MLVSSFVPTALHNYGVVVVVVVVVVVGSHWLAASVPHTGSESYDLNVRGDTLELIVTNPSEAAYVIFVTICLTRSQ